MNKTDQNIRTKFPEIVHEVTSRKQWAEKMLNGLRDIRNSRGANRSRLISQLEADILLSIKQEKDEKLLNEKIRQANQVFLNQMSKKHPELSPYDLMLCAYIRSNIDNALIAELRGIDVRSINMAKHRLKKKLGLNAEQDMNEFIKEY